MSDVATIATNFPRRDARDKLCGRTRYTMDRARPGMLHAALARAQIPSARIIRIDTAAARRMPGVRAIVTGADAPFRHGIGIADHPLFAVDRVRYDGEPIAVVAADTLSQAQAAAAAIVIEFEALPAVISMADALAPGAPLVHPQWQDYEVLFEGAARAGNIAWEATVVRGDVDAAFARDDIEIIESSFRVGRQNHLSLEPRAVIASYEDGRPRMSASQSLQSAVASGSSSIGRSSRSPHSWRGRPDVPFGWSTRGKRK